MIRRLVLLLAALALTAPVAAHQQKIAISTVSVNPRTDRLEVVHQVPVHDAEHALRRRGAASADIVGEAASREAFACYVASRFVIEAGGEPVVLAFVGSEIEAGTVFIYQDAPAPPPGTMVSVNSQILTDFWAKQENRVNIGNGTQVTTFVFKAGDAAQQARLPG